MEIIWKGNEHTNYGSRNGHVPFIIVDHISAGTLLSMDEWFRDPGNQISSAHFGVGKNGEIHQYVYIENAAWAQGISAQQMKHATAKVVKDMGVNPNLYCVSIEHEGHDGDLTRLQFKATLWLHRYIQQYINNKWGKNFPLDEYHVIGHYQINPKQKPNCPGPKFPWDALYAALEPQEKESEDELKVLKASMKDLETQIVELQNKIKHLEHLSSMPEIPEWAKESIKKAVQAGLVHNPDNGSYDFYRFITILDRKGVL